MQQQNSNGNGSAAKNGGNNNNTASKPSTMACKVLAIGLSHNTATVDIREKLSIPEDQWNIAADALKKQCAAVSEVSVLSTCNRFELYLVCSDVYQGTMQVTEFLSQRSGIPVKELRQYLFVLPEDEAVWHLLRVSAGLDSLVIGEGQILSQVKKCYEISTSVDGSAGKILNRLLNVSVSAGKRVRSETNIAKGAVSISSAAVELAHMKAEDDLLKPLNNANVAIIGAGKMSRLLVQHLVSHGVNTISIVNRSRERAEELAKMFPEFNLDLQPMDEMLRVVSTSDIVFTSTAAQEPILDENNVTDELIPKDRKIMLIDISVPRNIAQELGGKQGLSVYNVDDLKTVVAKNQARRRRLVLDAECLLKQEQTEFRNWQHSLGSIPAITKLQERAESIRLEELEKVASKLTQLSEADRKTIEKVTKGIVNKMLHGPMSHLRTLQDVEERTQTLKSLEAMFKLDSGN